MKDKIRYGVLEVGTQRIEYELILSSRKTVGISIDPEKGVIVRAPKYLALKTVTDIIQTKSDWITKKSAEMQLKREEKPVRKYVDGEYILYLGRSYLLNIRVDKSRKKSSVLLKGDVIEVTLSGKSSNSQAEAVQKLLVLWYKEQALDYIQERVEYYSGQCSEKPKEIIVKEQKRRWGSCSQKGVIRFNWRCVMAPTEVFDYVIVHEMCHLRHMNHGENFWKMVRTIMPDYLEKRAWLKCNGYRLEL